ncbi:DUF411 domain-containing protein [Jeongeupia sp. USM3]|uniref:DUF411 domain-containing protein n=1 Tax=Jeongeupia sp. USM3 TaxID=1906741 RepID=UPI00089DE6A6|nr:DUF411 domain-containing protein [Jeongeupia sp. USM3]AOY01826.1 hypothetical protein BJP62_16040 [Jeongeupia sp. USM3]
MKPAFQHLATATLFALSTAAWAGPQATLYKSPGCGCCGEHARYLEQQGWQIRQIESNDMSAIKTRYGTAAAPSCHTLVVGKYAIEGHVPVAAIDKLLKQQPKNVKAISAPGMPANSPGMGPYTPGTIDVVAVDAAGKVKPWGKF